MQNVIWIILLSGAFMAQLTPTWADATPGQKEVTEKILKSYARSQASKDTSKELCEQVMRSPRAKARMCELLRQDPEARRLLGIK